MNNQTLGHAVSRRAVLIGSAGISFSSLFVTGCQPSSLVAVLGDVVTAAELALPVIGSAVGLQPATLDAIVKYLQLVDSAVTQATNILAGPGTAAQKAAQILSAFAAIANGCNCIPAGTPAVVVSVVTAVIQAVEKFLANFKPSSTLMAQPAKEIKLKATDRAALANIRVRAEQNAAKVKDLVKK